MLLNDLIIMKLFLPDIRKYKRSFSNGFIAAYFTKITFVNVGFPWCEYILCTSTT